MAGDRGAKSVRAEDLAEDLPTIAARMRRIAHLDWNWMAPPRNIYGWDVATHTVGSLDPDAGTFGIAERGMERRLCDGWIPADLMPGAAGPTGAPVEREGDRWVHVADLQPYLVSRYLLVESQTRLIITYTVDVPPNQRPWRHLSLQVTVPGQVLQGELLAIQDELLRAQEPIVLAFFPAAALGTSVRAGIRAGDAWQVIDPTKPVDIRAATWKTPILFDFVMDHGLDQQPTEPAKRVRLYGPNGQPL